MSAVWSSGRQALGTWVKVPAPEVVELLALAGLDFIVIDGEHGGFDVRTVATMVSVAIGRNLAVFVRVPGHAPRDVQPALDAGATGLFVPHVDSVEIANEVVDSCRFPPEGHRGASPSTRAGGWGTLAAQKYAARGNADVILVAQIEGPSAAGDAEQIGSVSGIDALLVGSFDLTLASGLEPGSEAAREMIEWAEARCFASGLDVGGVAADGMAARKLFRRGHRFVVVSNDAGLLLAGARNAVSSAYTVVEQKGENETLISEGLR